jgi:hypothetical protein
VQGPDLWLRALDRSLHRMLAQSMALGYLTLLRLTWQHPAALLERFKRCGRSLRRRAARRSGSTAGLRVHGPSCPHTHTRTRAHTSTQTHARAHARTHARAPTHARAQARAHAHARTCTHTRTRTHLPDSDSEQSPER